MLGGKPGAAWRIRRLSRSFQALSSVVVDEIARTIILVRGTGQRARVSIIGCSTGRPAAWDVEFVLG